MLRFVCVDWQPSQEGFWAAVKNANKLDFLWLDDVPGAKLPQSWPQSLVALRLFKLDEEIESIDFLHSLKKLNNVVIDKVKQVDESTLNELRSRIALCDINERAYIYDKGIVLPPIKDIPVASAVYRCLSCPRTYGLSRCARCQEARFCSLQCQKMAWHAHKQRCCKK